MTQSETRTEDRPQGRLRSAFLRCHPPVRPYRTPNHILSRRPNGPSIRVARGVFYPPGTFRSRSVEWEETVHQDNGILGFTTKHLYFSEPKKKLSVRYDQIMDFEPFDDGFELMRDAQTAKPQSFQTGDGWFAFNMAQM